MDFSLSEEQQMVVDTLQRFVEKEYDFEARRGLAKSERGFSEDHWTLFAELGLLGLVVPDEFGGMEGGAADTLLVMEQFGRGLVLEPYVSTAVMAAGLIVDAGTASQKAVFLPGIVEGKRRLAVATLEPGARFDLWQVEATATDSDGGFVLNGRKAVVLDGDSADTLIVSARSGGAASDREGISLFLVDAGAEGVAVKGYPAIDGHRTAEVTLTDVALSAESLLGEPGKGYEVLEKAVDRGIAALCAEAVGTMAMAIEITAEYLRTRQQFGQPIGRFQALQHRVAEMLIATEQARAMAYSAAAALDNPDPVERRRVISAAKSMAGRSGRFVAQQAIQLHGGMGMTEECAVGHYCKRLNCIDMSWGNAEHHLELYSALM